jgi:nitrogen permease regulator 2-like protein
VCLENPKYERNQFIFNFGLVIEEGVGDWSGYGNFVRKVATLWRNLEDQGSWLTLNENDKPGPWVPGNRVSLIIDEMLF